MATEYLFSNNATTTLAQSVSATATVLNVAEGTGALFPSPSSGQAFAVTLVDAATGLTNEICYCTARSGDQLTVVRGREGTNAIAWSAGDTCANYITADVMESLLQESDLNGYATKAWANGQFLQLADSAEQTVSGPVTFTGATGFNAKVTNAPAAPTAGVGGDVPNTYWVDTYYARVTALQSEVKTRADAVSNLQNQINGKQPAGNYVTASQIASGIFDGSQGSTTSGTIVGGTWMRVGNTLTQNLVIEHIGGGTVTFPFAFSGNNNQVTVIVQDGTGSNNTYTTGSITTTGTGIHASGGGGTGRLHLTVSGPYGT